MKNRSQTAREAGEVAPACSTHFVFMQ